MQSALDVSATRGRFPLPAAISDAYGIGRTAGSLDRLYRDLVEGSRPAAGSRAGRS